MPNILSNNKQADRYEMRKRIEKLTPIGQMYFDNYEHVRKDDRTIILKKRK